MVCVFVCVVLGLFLEFKLMLGFAFMKIKKKVESVQTYTMFLILLWGEKNPIKIS